MKILTFQEFLKQPVGTVYVCKEALPVKDGETFAGTPYNRFIPQCEPGDEKEIELFFDTLSIKQETIIMREPETPIDFYYRTIFSSAIEREGLYRPENRYIVFSQDEVQQMIILLTNR